MTQNDSAQSDECEATQYYRAHKTGSTGSAFGWCGPKDEEEEDY